ncbi:hypothetical protein FDP41_007178 [Naegleria fowleri]|uniref:BTB domain-containing protein n=1 Tax=Naegleria fowleri TaxID=5763 RepID=A0A6A5BH65_NAEFO|nr:uncharacterized protein FDP41_007178 [Naegleria fowleri]KAF0973791.1 hypothetical protein FDP41_007178 [Naegleria fowleri]CAG4717106.1 unnamed protein product [Naegleria fowleri]
MSSSSKYPGKSLKSLISSRSEINSKFPHLYDAIIITSNGDAIPFFQLFMQINAPDIAPLKKEKNGVVTYKVNYDTEVTIKALEYILTGKINKEFENYKKVEEFLKTSGTQSAKWIKYTLPNIADKLPLTDVCLKSKLLKQPIQMHRLVMASHCTWFRTHLAKTAPSANKPTSVPSIPYVIPETYVKYLTQKKENYFTSPLELDLDSFEPPSEKHIRALVHFCYNDDLDAACEKFGITSEDEMNQMFQFAEKIGLIGIQGEYAKRLSKNMSLQNVGRIFSLSTKGEEQEVHDKAVQFILSNWSVLRKGVLKNQMNSEEENLLYEQVSGIANMFCLHKKNGLM